MTCYHKEKHSSFGSKIHFLKKLLLIKVLVKFLDFIVMCPTANQVGEVICNVQKRFNLLQKNLFVDPFNISLLQRFNMIFLLEIFHYFLL